LKAAGIFARLNHRDGKPGYLGDIPRTLGYVLEVAKRYDEFTEFGKFVDENIMPLICQESAGLPVDNNRRIEGVSDG